MKSYLESFFNEFAYTKEDADFFLGVYGKIIQDPKAKAPYGERMFI